MVLEDGLRNISIIMVNSFEDFRFSRAARRNLCYGGSANPWQSGSHDSASQSDDFITHIYHGCLGRIFQLNPRQLVSTCGSCAGSHERPVTYGNASGSIIQYGYYSTKQESCHQSSSSAQIYALSCFLGYILHSQQNSLGDIC